MNYNETLIYKDARETDLEAILDIYNETIASGRVTADTEPVGLEERLPWFKSHDPAKRPLWIIEDQEEKLIGWVSFRSFYGRPAYDGTAEIAIYLATAQRGRGWGRQVLSYCIRKAPELGIDILLGFIFSENEPSIRLFEQLGFEQWGLLPDVATIFGQKRSLKIMGRRTQ
ncbi:GNAT family N-acetyltransferase [Niabella terrae]